MIGCVNNRWEIFVENSAPEAGRDPSKSAMDDRELVSILHPGLGAVFKGVKTAEFLDQKSMIGCVNNRWEIFVENSTPEARRDPSKLDSTKLGKFKGVKTAEFLDQKSSSVAQFRGIKFARIPTRFR
jgi:hypothetical protein